VVISAILVYFKFKYEKGRRHRVISAAAIFRFSRFSRSCISLRNHSIQRDIVILLFFLRSFLLFFLLDAVSKEFSMRISIIILHDLKYADCT